ncbi:MAG TPA: thiamine pyrophosphate-binding protein [candidate division Zixibacteria bacterium]|nr:thiamine pyrophosphate-binding protein [candidate division Zixibacteria bacterium]
MARAQKIEKPRAEWGSDVIVDLLKAFEFEYVALNPGATFRGLHDSLVNYGGNHAPEIILCTHEEIAVALAHGYARAKGRPMAAAVHNVVGLQHAAMAIYNAWCDRLPVIVLGGTGPMDTANRRPWIDWVHTALVQGNLVRDFVKWDDQPASVEAIPDSFIRAYRLATTDPQGPVYLCYDGDVQEKRLDGEITFPSLDRYPAPLPLQAPEEGFEKTVRMLLEARRPVIVADWVGRREAGFRALGELAELLAAPVLDQFGRFNFPVHNPLNLTGQHEKVIPQADLLLALDVPDLEGAITKRVQEKGNRRPSPLLAPGAKIINVALDDLLVRAWSADFNKLREADLMILADTSVFLPELVRRLRAEKERLGKLQGEIDRRRAEWGKLYAEKREALEKEKSAKWDERPIAMTRLYAELSEALKGEDWVLTNGSSQGKENLYLPATNFNQILGKYKGGGLGYGLPASLGAALACKGSGKFCVDIQPDGDLLFTVSGLWTAVHHKIPLLVVVCSNRSYFNDEEHQERIAIARNRPVENKTVGIRIEDPEVDFGAMARTYGCWGAGPITEPRDLTKTLREAVKVVKEGRPALVDVVCQMR